MCQCRRSWTAATNRQTSKERNQELPARLTSLDALDAFRAQRLVPAHGELAEASAISQYRSYLTALQARVAELKGAGKSSEEAAELLRAEFRAKYPDWAQPLRVHAAVNAIYAELP